MSATEDFWPDGLVEMLEVSLTETRRRFSENAPALCRRTFEWMSALSGGQPLAMYFTRPRAFPLLLLPWWLESAAAGAPSDDFQQDLVYSTINGYYAVRLVDDLMDGDATPPIEVIPALEFFHTEFTNAYSRHFPFDHPFWGTFNSVWFGAAEAASRDATLETIDRAQFIEVSSRKTNGAKVPLAAVCHRYGRLELLERWFAFVELFGAWHQMLNDIIGWNRDLAGRRPTYFLSHAEASSPSPDSIAEWVVAEGLAWGMTELNGWMDKLTVVARDLQSPPLVAYLEQRQRAIEQEWQRLGPDLTALSRLATAMRSVGRSPHQDG